MPHGQVGLAIKLIWIGIAVDVGLSLLGVVIGVRDAQFDFAATLVLTGFLCIIPYKLQQRSHGARFAFLVLYAIGLLGIIGLGMGNGSGLERIRMLIAIGLNGYCAWLLLQSEANEWFGRKII